MPTENQKYAEVLTVHVRPGKDFENARALMEARFSQKPHTFIVDKDMMGLSVDIVALDPKVLVSMLADIKVRGFTRLPWRPLQ